MKRLSITSLGVSFMGILRRNNVLFIALSYFIIGTAFLLFLQYEKGMDILQNKWQPLYDIRGKDAFLSRSPIIKGQPADLTRYNIRIDLKAFLNEKGWGSLEIRFCDKYNLILTRGKMPSGVYYYKTDNSAKEYASKKSYKKVITGKETTSFWLQNLNLYLGCDLIEKTTSIYINGKFMEKVSLAPETRHYDVKLSINLKNVIPYKVEISDRSGKILFSANYVPLFFYKLASQILIFFGLLIFLALACSENRFFKRSLYFVFILLCIEGFLRIGEKDNENFNIHKLVYKWNFAATTNLYGTYDNPKEIEIGNYYYPLFTPKVYQIPKPANTRRIICMGSSPVAGFMLPNPAQHTFPELLENKINHRNRFRYEVINAAIPGETSISSPELNIYLKEVLFKLDPDLILLYTRWIPPKAENRENYLLKDYILYNRAKKIMEQNFSWIKNDQLLYAALEFKKPMKEVVYLYNFLCNSYLFIGLENVRKSIFNKLYDIRKKPPVEEYEPYFEETLRLCREKKIKMLLVIPFHFFDFQSEPVTKREILRVIREHPEVYYLDLEKAFRANKDFSLAYDLSHPTEYGHMIIAEEIFKKLAQMGLIDTDPDQKINGTGRN